MSRASETPKTPGRALALASPRPNSRPSMARPSVRSDFLSQLIAERNRLPPQRNARRASPATAVDAYRSGRDMAVARMPQGYRTTIIA